jgi:hypothetical protein
LEFDLELDSNDMVRLIKAKMQHAIQRSFHMITTPQTGGNKLLNVAQQLTD